MEADLDNPFILITDKKVINPISVVSVLPDDQQAESRIHRSRNHMNEIINHYSSGETKVNTIATIDHNLSSGIARTSKELAADIVVINDSDKMNLIMRIVGDDREHLLDVCDKTVFFCQLDMPFISKRRIILICPELAELENSFTNWLDRVMRLSRELNLPTIVFSGEQTYEKINLYTEQRKFNVSLEQKQINELDEFFLLNYKIESTDLVIYCSARKGAISYTPSVDFFLNKLEKAFPNNDRILIYPSQLSDNLFNSYDDISTSPITKGMETIQKIGKEVGSIFKGNEKN